MKGIPVVGLPELTLQQWIALVASLGVTVLAAFISRPRKSPPAVSVPTSSGGTMLFVRSKAPRRRAGWRWWLLVVLLAVVALSPAFPRHGNSSERGPAAVAAPPAPCGSLVAWGDSFVAAGVTRREGLGNRVVVCVLDRQSKHWRSVPIEDGDDAYIWSPPVIFDGRAVLVGTVGTRAADRQLHYDAAIWTCSAASSPRCAGVPDPGHALGGPRDQYIRTAKVDGSRLTARGGSGRGADVRQARWTYDGLQVTRQPDRR